MSEVRYVTVPATITIQVQEEDGSTKAVEVPFQKFLDGRTADAGVFGVDLDGIMLGLEVRQAFHGALPGTVIGLRLPVWESLCKSIRKPHGGYHAAVMIQLVDYARAVIDAPSKPPRVEAPAAEAAPAAVHNVSSNNQSGGVTAGHVG